MERVSGTWVHPADGDNYPRELRMTVTESSALGITSWETTTDYGEPFGVSRWQYIFGAGGRHIMFAVFGKLDGKWSELRAMDEKWSAPDGEVRTAREVMRRFFTEGGYTRVGN